MNVEPTLAHRTAEVESTKIMIDRGEAQFDIKPERLIGETAYGTCDGWPNLPLKGHRSRDRCACIQQKNLQINPLTEQQRSTKGRETTQCGESVLRCWSCLSSGDLKIRLFQQNRPEAVTPRIINSWLTRELHSQLEQSLVMLTHSRVFRPNLILLVRHFFQPPIVLAVQGFLHGYMGH